MDGYLYNRSSVEGLYSTWWFALPWVCPSAPPTSSHTIPRLSTLSICGMPAILPANCRHSREVTTFLSTFIAMLQFNQPSFDSH